MPADPHAPANRHGTAGRIRQRIGDPDARDRRQRTMTWILLAAVGVLLVNAIVGENGYMARVQTGHEEAALMHAVARLRVENQRLQDTRLALESDPASIEDAARRELGMLRPGEAVVIVRDTPPIPSAPPVR